MTRIGTTNSKVISGVKSMFAIQMYQIVSNFESNNQKDSGDIVNEFYLISI